MTIREKFLHGFSILSTKHPKKTIALFIALMLFSIIYSILNLKLMTDQDKLISEDLAYYQNYMKFLNNFGDKEYFYIIGELEDHPELTKHFIDEFSNELKNSNYFTEVYSKIDLEFWQSFLFLKDEQIQEIKSVLNDTKSKYQQYNNLDLNILLSSLNKADFNVNPYFLIDPILDEILNNLKGKSYQSKIDLLKEKITNQMKKESYITSDDGQLVMILALPKKDYTTMEVVKEPLDFSYSLLKKLKEKYPKVKAGITGRPVLQADEMATTDKDMTFASIISLLGVTILFIIFLRNIVRPLLTSVTLFTAIAITFGFVVIVVGHLNILSLVFAILLVGLGIDYGIHFISRYHEELRKNNTVEDSIIITINTSGKGNLTGGITSVAALYTAVFINFQGLSELGLIAGSGLLITLLSMTLLLPSLLFVFDSNKDPKKLNSTTLIQLPILLYTDRYKPIIIPIWIIITILFTFSFFKWGIGFNNNILDLHADKIQSVEYEKKLINSSESSWFAAYIVRDESERNKRVHSVKNLESVSKIESLNDYISESKLQQFNKLKNDLFKIKNNTNSISLTELSQNLNVIKKKILIDKKSFIDSKIYDLDKLEKQINEINNFIQTEPEKTQLKLSKLNSNLIHDFNQGINELELIFKQYQNQNNILNSLPGPLKNKFLENSVPKQLSEKRFHTILNNLDANTKGNLKGYYSFSKKNHLYYLKVNMDKNDLKNCEKLLAQGGFKAREVVYAYPKGDIWPEENMRQFVEEVRSVDKDATGAIMTFYETSLIIQKELRSTMIYIFIIVVIFLLLDFKSIKYTFLALIPLILGLIWLAGFMALTSQFKDWMNPIQFNLANFFGFPLIIGTGIDYGVHIVHRYKENIQSKNLLDNLKGITSAVSLTAFTTMMGFGALMTASHKGMASLGTLLFLGIFVCYLQSIFVLPHILNFIHKRKA